ncbi:putative leucine-rich repeat-containing protein DDB_G0290503 isoform X2 [Oppia nitens]|uniref:putative leucine-rich repeat-containing protein DDB_G0290503 isoform X2 n=1 Tax=Oppia nitens TaxID=1686743 RepID=UPI0023DAD28F|nr:putative leucine-rich repeat-containing protein DDB_G0290503 isoform X2 [Oppia nitens]
MDIQTPIICVGVVAVTSAAVYLSSVFGIRERTYEEAIEEQRKSNNLELTTKTTKTTDKFKKEKKDKKKDKDKTNKKESLLKHKTVNGSQQQTADHKPSRKVDHAVEFKPEPEVVLLSDIQTVDISRHRKPSNEKPIKPILLNKCEQNIDLNDSSFQLNVNGRNSFDSILPKDEFELLKDLKKGLDVKPSLPEPEPQVISVVDNSSDQKTSTNYLDNESQQQSTPEPENKAEVVRTEHLDNSSPARRSRKSKQNQLEGNVREVSANTIIDLVRTTTLNNEEIQLLTDILLNKQTDGSTEWRKKNDPLAVLKKQLIEKETELEKTTKNLTAAVQKTRELRNELEVEKSRQLNNRDKSQQMQLEVQTLHIKLQQSYDSHRSEVSSLQKQLQQIQVKYSEERSHKLRIQDENQRFQQLLANEQHMKHELDQLRNDRQQYEMRINNTQKANEELIRKTQQLDNRIISMTEVRQKDESAYQKHIQDISQELQKCETQRNSFGDELNHIKSKCNSLESESIQFLQKFKDLENSKNDEIKRLINDFTELSQQKKILEKALTDAKHEQQNGEQNNDKQEANRLNEELVLVKEELKNMKNICENQLRNYEELNGKYRLANESIENFDKIKKQSVESALKISDDKNNQLKSEMDVLKEQINSLNVKLNETEKAKHECFQQMDLIKQTLIKSIPSLDTNNKDWISSIEIEINQQLSHNSTQSSSDVQQRLEDLESVLKLEKEKSNQFANKCSEYESTLSQTELILSELQTKLEAQESNIRSKETDFENKLMSHSNENSKLRDEIKRLELTCVQMEELQETIASMDSQLKELQSKLSGEENEKKILEQRIDEASKSASNLKQELVAFENERSELELLKTQFEETKTLLEKEKKISKDLNQQNVRLNSLVRIGHESLKQETDKVRQLEAQLHLNNGGLSSSVNGSKDTTGNTNNNIEVNNESNPLTTGTNPSQTQTPFLSNITNNKSKRRAASAKK